MKAALLLLILFLASLASCAALRYDKPAPMLHSVLDSPARQRDGWINRMNSPMSTETQVRIYSAPEVPADVRKAKGIRLMIAGAICLTGGGVLFYFDERDRQQQQASGGPVYNNYMRLVSAIVLAGLGVVFVAIGLPMWLDHLED